MLDVMPDVIKQIRGQSMLKTTEDTVDAAL